jgi:hypothetical protein
VYNGSCEAGIGSMKTRTHHESSRLGHPGEWSCDDVEAARLQANETARPWRLHRPTPEEVWRQRRRISAKERTVFSELVIQHEQEAIASEDGVVQVASVRRTAIAQALVASGLLEYRRERQVSQSGKCPEESAGKPAGS